MEIVPLSVPGTGPSRPVGLPFNRRNVEEWSRLDAITGIMEKTKIETDGWSASNRDGKHNFAKVVDCRERNLPDGSLQQKQRKQMEMFQTMVPGGSMQVIRTQTVTSSSTSSWSSGKPFAELQLPVNQLDLSSQKTKGSVGRSGSIGGRRPPTRPRSLASQFNDHFANLSAECHRMHEEAKARVFGRFSNGFSNSTDDHDDDDPGGVVITEIDSSSESSGQKTNLSRQKSCSNENVNEENSSIQRSSKFRRSLQIPKTTITDDIPDWTNGKSLRERASEIENLLRMGSSTTTTSFKPEVEEQPEIVQPTTKTKSSFVTAETLQEVRDRLRKSSNSDTDGKDEGIVGDSICVKDFISGFEGKSSVNREVNGFGSLSYRSNKSSLTNCDWIRRRKSYGFEKVDSDSYEQSNGNSSADSGLGNTTESKFSSPFRRFVNGPLSEAEAAFTRKSPLPTRERASLRCNRNPWLSQLRGTKLIDRDWSDGTSESENVGTVESPKSVDMDTKGFDFEHNQKKQKKVEFCKTEVHFTTEPGRFHIVETDGKPPASAVLRRSRRSAGRSSPPHNPLGLPEVKFGDSVDEKKLLGSTSAEKIDHLSKRIETELKELSKMVIEPPKKEQKIELSNPTHPKLYDLHEEESDALKPRSILKGLRNSFHAGDTAKPSTLWNSTVILRNKTVDEVKVRDQKSYSSDGESELQIRFRNLKKTDDSHNQKEEPIGIETKRRSFPDEVLLKGSNRITAVIHQSPTPTENLLSVAERIKQAEETYSSKIHIRSGEATVVQNGTHERKKDFTTWPHRTSNCLDNDSNSSNRSVKRVPSKEITTTRISINIPCATKTPLTSNKNKPVRSCSFGSGSQGCEKPQSASLVLKTLHDTEILKIAKPVHEMIHKFDSLARPVKPREQRRRTMPINYKTPKEYTHADLEEELRSFTENLDKDFKDIYEEEIGSLKGSCRDIKTMFEQVAESAGKPVNDDRLKTLPLANGIRKRLTNVAHLRKIKNRVPCPVPPKPSPPQHSKDVDSDDSDLLADEEVRSYMSAGHDGSGSEDQAYPAGSRKKSFDRIRRQFKRLEARDHYRQKESTIITNTAPVKPTPVTTEPHYAAPPKVASISLRYEDDPAFQPKTKSKDPQDKWERTSNSSSNVSDSRRERASYLKGPSLSEKFSKTNSSLDNLFEGSALQRVKEIQENIRNSFRSSRSSRFREVVKEDSPQNNGMELTLEELSRAADSLVVAANGLTDDSLPSSSDDEPHTRKIIAKGNVSHLSTISEGRKSSVTTDSKRSSKEKSLSSRATRLMQRASHREATIAQRSSSEDIPTNVEQAKKKAPRRPRAVPAKMECAKEDSSCKQIYSRSRVRGSIEKETCAVTSVPRERSKTVSSAAKEVHKPSSRSSQIVLDRTERTKPSERRQLLAKADAAAEQSIKNKKTITSNMNFVRNDQNRDSLTKRRAKISLRKVEATRVSQAV